jgi:hypothetical protein
MVARRGRRPPWLQRLPWLTAPMPAKTRAAPKPPRRAKKSAKAARKAPARARPVKAAKADGAAPVKAYIARLPAWQGRLLRRFDALVAEEVPDARRAVKWSAPFYGVPGNGWFASAKGFSRHVKIVFFRGANLDPVPPSGEHEQGRALDLREGDAMDEALVRGWIRQASRLPGWGTS